MNDKLRTVLIIALIVAVLYLILFDSSVYDPSLEDCIPDPQFGGC